MSKTFKQFLESSSYDKLFSNYSKERALNLLGFRTELDPIDDPDFKEKFIKKLLTHYSNGHLDRIEYVESLIALARVAGYDYPEFKAIEKSINASK